MRNKILLCGLIIVIMALIMIFGYTNARYYSTASMTGDLDYVKSIGDISIYHPEWVEGYTGPDDGSGSFQVSSVPLIFDNIHLKVTNTVDNKINEEEVSYYIRIVAEDGSNNMPIEYDIHEYNTPSNVLPLVTGVGYGPFTLSANSEETQYYSIKANYNTTDSSYFTSVQHLKVQMVKERTDGTLKVIDETPLNMEYTGKKVKATFAYYLYGTNISIAPSQTVHMDDNLTIDFKNSDQLNELGIVLPGGEYTFHDVRGILPGYGRYATTVNIPEGDYGAEYWFEVYMVSSEKIGYEILYFTSTGTNIDPAWTGYVALERGTNISWFDEDGLRALGFDLRDGYTVREVRKIEGGQYVKITSEVASFESEMEQRNVVLNELDSLLTVNIHYYDRLEMQNENDTLEEYQIDITIGQFIDFCDEARLDSLGIPLPSGQWVVVGAGYDFPGSKDNGETVVEIVDYTPYVIEDIFVFLEMSVSLEPIRVDYEISGSTNVGSTTIHLNGNDLYLFTTENCRTLCPELASKTSFTIYIKNEWGSTCQIGNTVEDGTVTVDYNNTYTLDGNDFKLTDEGSYIYIIAWW